MTDTHDYFSAPNIPAGACVGHPSPGVELRIEVGHQDSSEESDSSDGEVWLRAPHMSCGMITPNGFVSHEPDGWHQTGDLGHIDAAGRLVLTGRLADVIKTGGFKVNPDEIEALLSTLGASTQVCVTAVPSDYWGEIIVAVAELAFEGWESVAQERVKPLSRHKHPRLFLSVEALPRNPQGKVSRRAVRELILRAYELLDGPYPKMMRR
jgi:O-succinylbenzoic acid--CoA ligase